jgi:hypothetical protein
MGSRKIVGKGALWDHATLLQAIAGKAARTTQFQNGKLWVYPPGVLQRVWK